MVIKIAMLLKIIAICTFAVDRGTRLVIKASLL